jgi:hypothetical protein
VVTLDTIRDDLACGCTVAETYTDVEVLKARLELEGTETSD